MKKINKILAMCLSITDKPYFSQIHQEVIDTCMSAIDGDITAAKALSVIYDKCCDVLDTGCYDTLTSDISLIALNR